MHSKHWVGYAATTAEIPDVKPEISESFVRFTEDVVRVRAVELGKEGGREGEEGRREGEREGGGREGGRGGREGRKERGREGGRRRVRKWDRKTRVRRTGK